MISLENKIALVTGASRGIGAATAVLLATLGADVYVNYNQSYDEAVKVAREIEKIGRKSYLVRGELSKQEDVRNMFEFIKINTGSLDILVNNAGIFKSSYVKYMAEETWDLVMDSNLKSAFMCSKYSISFLAKSENPCIVNVASIAAENARIGQLGYNASKAGLVSITKTMAKELSIFGIRVNAVSPGPVRTDMNKVNAEEEESLKKLIPLKRIAEVEDVANTIAYLCSPIANYITGQVLTVDGGLTL